MAWQFYAKQYRPHFNRDTSEPRLTKQLCTWIARVEAPKMGLLGSWSSEGVIGDPDLTTGEMLEERRTDIVYGWNDDTAGEKLELVFEFKRLRATKGDRNHYLGDKGLQRFVTGIYSHGQACAVMVGVLRDQKLSVVMPLIAEFALPARIQKLALVPQANGATVHKPSNNFATRADFDTEHLRPAPKGPPHGRIQISHLFLEFGYP